VVRRLLDEQDYPLELRSITCAAVFVWGDCDRLAVWPRNGERLLRLASSLPNARNEVIAGCGHAPQLEAPGVLLELIDSLGSPTGRTTHLRPSTPMQEPPVER
jgi:pimeloyl-ACP methyl ester carboxylesterase